MTEDEFRNALPLDQEMEGYRIDSVLADSAAPWPISPPDRR